VAVQHNGFLAAGAGDLGRSGEGFESAGVSEAGAVVAELAQQRAQLDAHRVLHDRWLVQVGVGEDRVQPLDIAVEMA
jgi:hypothetical protein